MLFDGVQNILISAIFETSGVTAIMAKFLAIFTLFTQEI